MLLTASLAEGICNRFILIQIDINKDPFVMGFDTKPIVMQGQLLGSCVTNRVSSPLLAAPLHDRPDAEALRSIKDSVRKK